MYSYGVWTGAYKHKWHLGQHAHIHDIFVYMYFIQTIKKNTINLGIHMWKGYTCKNPVTMTILAKKRLCQTHDNLSCGKKLIV